MTTRKVMLTYPEHLIQEPVLFRMVRRFDVMPNIRRARVTDSIGEIALELEGDPAEIDRGIRFLQEAGVQVVALEGDIVSP